MANKVYVQEETAITFDGTVGADVALSFEGVADDAGRISARKDLGAAPRSEWYEWRAKVKWQANPTEGSSANFYLATSDGTIEDGDVGTADAALADEDVLKNLHPLGAVIADNPDTTDMQASGICRITSRYVSVVAWNDGGAVIDATDSNFTFILTPIPPEIQ